MSAAADARAIARNPAGWNSRAVAAKPATRSGSAVGENMLGSMTARNSSRGSAAGSRQKHPLGDDVGRQ
jgi:hypothetical protein